MRTGQTHGSTAPLTIAGAVFMGMGEGTQKYTQGLPVSCLTHRFLYPCDPPVPMSTGMGRDQDTCGLPMMCTT